MFSNFSEYLYQFSLSVDLVEDETLNEIRGIIWQYLQKALSLCFLEELHPTKVNNDQGLKIVWGEGTDQKGYSNALKKADGSYSGQTSYAYDHKKPMWIVARNNQTLLNLTDCYDDYWSDSKNIPKYWKFHQNDIRTSIIITFKIYQNNYGILNLESHNYLKFDKKLSEELSKIANSLGILVNLCTNNEERLQCTRKAVRNLRATSDRLPLRINGNNRIFLASSNRANNDVIGAIRNVLSQFSSYDIIYWKDISDSGNINEQIIHEISNSSFGIIYLSESQDSKDSGNTQYKDNPNVLFEAGMFQALTKEPTSPVFGWIPIREKESSRIPFDFASDRILIIPRLHTGQLNKESFEEQLTKLIQAIVTGG